MPPRHLKTKKMFYRMTYHLVLKVDLSCLSVKLLKNLTEDINPPSKETLDLNAKVLEGVLSDYSINGDIASVRYGPVVTRYDLEPAPGLRSQRVISLADDIARSMSVEAVRVAMVPGQNVIGIELPNKVRETVILRNILEHEEFKASPFSLPVCLGKNIAGFPIVVDLSKMPHLLVCRNNRIRKVSRYKCNDLVIAL